LSKKLAIIIIIGITIFTGISTYLASKLQFDYDFEHFFPENDTDLDYFLQFRKTYENDNDYVLIAIGEGKSVFDVNFLKKANGFAKELQQFNHVESIISPTFIKEHIINAFGFIEVPILHINNQNKLKNDSVRISNSAAYKNTLFAKDFTSICIVVHNDQIITKKASDELLNDIEDLLKKYNFKETHFAGKIRGQKTYLTKMKKELILFLSLSVLLISFFLLLSFRSFFGVIVPIVSVLIAIVGALGIMQFFGKDIDVMTTLLPTILFVVGMSDAVHIINRYIEEIRNGKEKLVAIKFTFKEVGLATFLTSITTAVGFITLMMVSIRPIQEFGLYTAIGVILAFIIAILFLPAILSLIKKPKIAIKNNDTIFWKRFLSKLFLLTIKNPKKIIFTYCVVIIFSVIGMFQLKVDYHLLEDLSEKNPLQQDFRFFVHNYAGIRPFEMVIASKNGNSIFDFKVMKEMDKVEQYLYTNYKAGFIFSPVAVIKSINKATHGGSSQFYKIPKNEKKYNKLIKRLRQFNFKKKLANLLKSNEKECRFTGKMDDIGSAKVKILNANFKHFFNTKINTKLITYKMTGTALLVDKNNEFLARNMMLGLAIAFLLIALIMGGIFKSFKMAIISLIPNIIPLALIAGVMGYFGTSINMATSIIFTIAFGIAVDDTIHFLSKFKIESSKNKSFFIALRRSYLSTGKAIILTTLILCGGFVSLIFSDFKSTFLIGVYVSLILFFAVITDLLLLPVLLIIFKRSPNKK